MAKKDFKTISSQAAEMFMTPREEEDQEELKPQDAEGAPTQEEPKAPKAQKGPKTPKEQEEPKEPKNQKIQKLNIAFYGNNMEYLNIISRVKGISITQYINEMVTKDQEGKEELISKAKEFFEDFK